MEDCILYGDGIHDDTDAIQALIDSGVCEVSLPAPKVRYLISRPLVIPSNFKLKLPRYAEIKLADGSNCFMLQNKVVSKPETRLRDFLFPLHKEIWKFYDLYSPDTADTCHDFEIEGGIWNFNNMKQLGNPEQTRVLEPYGYSGDGMLFYGVKGLRMANMTF